MGVRAAVDADLPVIAEIAVANDEKEGADPHYVAHLRSHGRFLVAEADGRTAGYCGVRRVGPVRLCLPGPHPALRRLLDAGWRIEDSDQHMSSRPDLLSPADVLSPSLG
jgi:hypothetical protein